MKPLGSLSRDKYERIVVSKINLPQLRFGENNRVLAGLVIQASQDQPKSPFRALWHIWHGTCIVRIDNKTGENHAGQYVF